MARRLLLLNGLAIIAIVLHHAAVYGLQAMFQWSDNYHQMGSISYYGLLMVPLLDRFALPSFLCVSGYFIAFMGRGSSNLSWQQLLPRIRILLVPFVLWTVARFILLRQPPASVDELLNPYHFIPVLIQFYLLSPYIIRLARRNWRLLLLAAAFFQLLLLAYRYCSLLGVVVPFQAQVLSIPRWLFTEYIFWFPFGVVFGLHSTTFTRWLVDHRRFLLTSLVVVTGLSIVEFRLVAYQIGEPWVGPSFRGVTGPIYALLFMLTFLSLDEKGLPIPKQVAELGVHSLGIYMVNIPAIYVIAVLLYHLTPWVLGIQLLYQPILIAAGLGLPLFLMEMLRRSPASGTYRYVFG